MMKYIVLYGFWKCMFDETFENLTLLKKRGLFNPFLKENLTFLFISNVDLS